VITGLSKGIKVQKKNWIEVILMPLVVALVGILGTYLITAQQEDNARAKATSDRQVKMLEIFSSKITSEDKKQRLMAINLLGVMDDELAEKLATAVEQTEQDAGVRRAAARLAGEARARMSGEPMIYIHVAGSKEDESGRDVQATLDQHQGWYVQGIDEANSKMPPVSTIRYFRRADRPTADEIAATLSSAGHTMVTHYVRGYEASVTVPAKHFEVWLTNG